MLKRDGGLGHRALPPAPPLDIPVVNLVSCCSLLGIMPAPIGPVPVGPVDARGPLALTPAVTGWTSRPVDGANSPLAGHDLQARALQHVEATDLFLAKHHTACHCDAVALINHQANIRRGNSVTAYSIGVEGRQREQQDQQNKRPLDVAWTSEINERSGRSRQIT